jgi:hypothetical protein
VDAPALGSKKEDELNVLKSANAILENYKIEIMDKVRFATIEGDCCEI